MSAKTQHNNILLAIVGFAAAVAIVALIGFFALGRDPEMIQGQVEVSEYRVSSKVPGRILEIRVKEGDYVKVGIPLPSLMPLRYVPRWSRHAVRRMLRQPWR